MYRHQRGTILVLAFLLACAAAHVSVGPLPVDRTAFEQWTCIEKETCVSIDHDSMHEISTKTFRRFSKDLMSNWFLDALSMDRQTAQFVSKIREAQVSSLEELHTLYHSLYPLASGGNASNPYFACIPMPVAAVKPGGAMVTFSTGCFGQITASATYVNTTHVQVTITVPQPQEFLCSDAFMLYGGSVSLQSYDAAGAHTILFDVNSYTSTTAGQWYINNWGIQILKFQDPLLTTLGQLIDTATLLSGFAQPTVSTATFNANYDFLRNYVEISSRMQPKTEWRTSGNSVAYGIDPTLIAAGDALLVLRPDGLDPMIGWGEGANIGHSTIAMRFPDTPTELHVCESTTLDAYWPTNGIQCHKWLDWLNLTTHAEMNIVWVPLSPANRALFNTTAAQNFFLANEGTDYGFQTFLFGWIDTANDNFPCVPDTYTTCLTSTTAEIVANIFDRIFENSHMNFFRQALAHRVGTWPAITPVADSIYIASKTNQTFVDLYQIPEQDSWLYNTTRNGEVINGKSMVCCVFVCNMWKAAGVFGDLTDEIQCGEQTLWDIFSMKIFDSQKMGSGRPSICQETDPNNQLCQLMGNFTLNLNPDVNTRPLYKNMGEKCASLGPNYIRSPGC